MPELSSARTSGLKTRGGHPVPLTGVEVSAELTGCCARVTVAQRFVNHESQPIEAVYTFPLDEGAAVCGFEAIVDGAVIVGEVKEREAAFAAYDDAMSEGHGAFLLDEERPDVFVASVGNLPPGAEATLTLTYVAELEVNDTGLRFVVPTTIAPRYAPAEDRGGVGRSPQEVLNPSAASTVPYGLTLTVRATMPTAIVAVESPSHPVRVRLDGREALVELSQSQVALDRDVVLMLDVPGLDAPQGWVERDDEGRETAAVVFRPSLSSEPVPSEVVFLVDCSGSMDGTSIEEVRKALQLCLRSLIPGCRFNIVSFGSSFSALFPESAVYDQKSLAAASAHVAAMTADMGGTEIHSALEMVLRAPLRDGLARQVIVLTDGEVTNTDAVLALAVEHAAAARVFTFGIGANASRHLVRGLARAGRGTAEFVAPGERIEPKVMRLFSRLLSPALTDIQVSWVEGQVTQAPSTLPAVFAGERCLVYGFVDGVRPASVRLTAKSLAGAIAFDVSLAEARQTQGRTVATLAARARIRELEESPGWLARRGSRQPRGDDHVRAEIVRLATRYSLLSRETSFIAIERRATPVTGDVQLRRVPIALASDWGALRAAGNAPAFPVPPPPMAAPTMAMSRNASFSAQAIEFARDAASAAMSRANTEPPAASGGVRPGTVGSAGPRTPAMARPGAAPGGGLIARMKSALTGRQASPGALPDAPSPAVERHGDPHLNAMHELIALQAADGSWALTRELARTLGRRLRSLERALGGDAADETGRRAWATALALIWLERHAAAHEVEWQALALKARRWLDSVPPHAEGSWLDVARRYLSSSVTSAAVSA